MARSSVPALENTTRWWVQSSATPLICVFPTLTVCAAPGKLKAATATKARSIADHFQRKGLALDSRSELAWTLPGKFGRLEGVAGIDDDVRPLGSVRLRIVGDGKTLLDAKIYGNDDSKKEPLQISLATAGVRRLVLIVESLGNFGAGDHLDLGNLRLIK